MNFEDLILIFDFKANGLQKGFSFFVNEGFTRYISQISTQTQDVMLID
jgi:hypothetical protein